MWIAHWYLDEYDPDATVWDTPCLSDSLWPGSRRLKQYAGGHDETWGGVRLRIDSNVLNGEVNLLPVGVAVASQPGLAQVVLERQSEPLRGMGLFSHSQGWVIAGERLLFTQDGGESWQDITPELEGEPECASAGGGVLRPDARLGGVIPRQAGWAGGSPHSGRRPYLADRKAAGGYFAGRGRG